MVLGSVSFSSSALASQGAAPPNSSRIDSDLTNALKSAGVDGSKVADILKQIKQAVGTAQQSGADPASLRNTINSVLQKNGVDVSKFESALKAESPSSQSAGTGPIGESKGASSPLASALSAAGVQGSEIENLINQITTSAASSSKSAQGTQSFRDTVNSVLQQNGVDVTKFDNALNSQLSAVGNFVNVSA